MKGNINDKYKEPNEEKINQELKDMYLVIETNLALKGKVKEKYIKQVLDKIIWNVTELEGKQNYKYCIKEALDKTEDTEHEHVFTKKYLIKKIIEFPNKYKEIIGLAIACKVTKDEHKNKLHKVKKKFIGWERYKEARIEVWDMVANKKANLDDLIEKQEKRLKELGII